jgi:beta-ketoacyl-acyl-carrier-protein synthase II
MDLLRNGRPRVVITGLGSVTALGPVKDLWESLKAGKSGVRRLETIPIEHVPVKIGGEVRNFDPTEYIDRKEARRMGRASHFAVAASGMAIEDAGLNAEAIEAEGERVGVVIGSSLGSHEMAEHTTYKYKTTNYSKPNPLALVNSLPNMPAHYVSRFFRTFGPLHAPSVACATGTQSIGEASDLIRNGRIDMAITGGVEAVLQDYALAGFDAMQALANQKYNDCPEEASRPFDADRDGFVFSEGCGVVILESLTHAIKRGARIYAEVLGYASSSDAFHIAALDPEGRGATRSMKWALQDAHLNPGDIQYINAHGSSTQANDAMETLAIKKVFGEQAYNIAVSSTKSMIGHALAGSGAIELIACAMSLLEKVIHPTINYHTPDPDCDLDYVPNVARYSKNLKFVLSNSFGLGGQNASIVLGDCP